jgi:SAM-dependent methyltransferase
MKLLYTKPGRLKMDEYMKENRDLWNEITAIHIASDFYNVEGFKHGRSSMLYPIELEEMGNVSGKSLLHLQCHFGMDTLSWARLGAKVTGVDFSDKSIESARSLSEEIGIAADFICSNIYDLPENLKGTFDIVYTSGGVLCWLSDLKRWAEIISHFLKPRGFFYILERHPFSCVFDDSPDVTGLKVKYSYFHTPEPTKWEPQYDYTSSVKGSLKWINDDPDAVVTHGSYEWTHSLGDIINALISGGLKIESLHEFPMIFYKCLSFMEQDDDGRWRIKGDKIPLIFSLKASKI